MMAHPQSSPRGLFAKDEIHIGSSKFMKHTGSLPGNVDSGVALRMLTNSTGVAAVVNTTGTTWKYLNTTSKQPT
jgi:hypothetical protein